MNWRRLLLSYAVWTLGIGLAIAVFIVALDPYDTGRFALFGSHGVPHFGQRLAAASLGRQPQFDTAIIGNSTMQLIEPEHLDAAGVHAVSLTMPGTGPLEQVSVGEWFVQHHPGNQARALIIGLDRRWCEANHVPVTTHPFPFWVYDGDDGDYVANLLSYQGFEAATRKIAMMLGWAKTLRADGYNNYQDGFDWDLAGFRARLKIPSTEGELEPMPPPYDFPAVPMLRDFLAQVPASTVVILAIPPEFEPASDIAPLRHACRQTYADLAASRPRTHLIDFLARPYLTSSEEDYWDRQHYRSRVAEVMEAKIEGVLR